MDAAAQIRRRQQDDRDAATAAPGHSRGNTTALAQTVTVARYPATAGVYYGVQCVRPGGTEQEGQPPSFTPYGGTFYALNLGTAVPPPGTYVLATLSGGRWAFRYDG